MALRPPQICDESPAHGKSQVVLPPSMPSSSSEAQKHCERERGQGSAPASASILEIHLYTKSQRKSERALSFVGGKFLVTGLCVCLTTTCDGSDVETNRAQLVRLESGRRFNHMCSRSRNLLQQSCRHLPYKVVTPSQVDDSNAVSDALASVKSRDIGTNYFGLALAKPRVPHDRRRKVPCCYSRRKERPQYP